MKEEFFAYESFVGGWYINKKLCDDLIKYYKKNPEKMVGYFGTKEKTLVDDKIKDSIDLTVHPNNKNKLIIKYRQELQKCLNQYLKKYEDANYVDPFNVNGYFNIQGYKKGGGYKMFHFERSGLINSNRILVFMTYLNTVPDGGTIFKYQKITAPAKQGLTLIWPTDWTHTHKGQVSLKNKKYIATGWFTFND
mgnify:FL=1|jgi:hypothetical protein|tara:strand:+ start:6282 stop:6860 length:579 start_codon:yes stop_codon:yes gene_type:complete